ncbi:DUF421 domain-containing protein [[Eubacterium] hominis]|uniref:DUF421 domain-containing protein n=1 Tax=[Eubacterium] hominis TaxID=2764325 RepID=UPI003A4E6190
MQEYLSLMVKCFVVYFVIIIALRLMGKREVGELSVFDIVIYLVMSELLAISITDAHESIFKSLVPIFTLAVLQIVISWVLLKSKKARDVFDGKCVILIHNGHINQREMQKNRYSMDDLMSQIRSKDLCTPDEVAFAILENNGQLSVLAKDKCKVKHPDPLVSDGTINQKALKDLDKDEVWLKASLKQEGIEDVNDVFLCLWQKNGFFVVKKELNSKNSFF